MIELAQVAKYYQDQLLSEYGHVLQASHHRALKQIIACHTPQAGAMLYHCDNCSTDTTLYPSCGHRHYPACQHHANSEWLNLQRQKLLPVDYYMTTLRCLINFVTLFSIIKSGHIAPYLKRQNKPLMLFLKVINTWGECNGLLAVLHTHSRKLDFKNRAKHP